MKHLGRGLALRVDDHDLKPGSLLHSDITLIVHGGSQIMVPLL